MYSTCFTGFLQDPNHLAKTMGCEAFDYANYASFEALKHDLIQCNPERVIGWSLGGQVAIRAICEKLITPKKLILLATPYQFVANDVIPDAMSLVEFLSFKERISHKPSLALPIFQQYMSGGIETLPYKLSPHATYWLDWLESFSCINYDLTLLPHTQLFHGDKDPIVPVTQLDYFVKQIPSHATSILKDYHHYLSIAPKVIEMD